MEPQSQEGFCKAEYHEALNKVLDLARDGHSFLLEGSLRLQVEVAKTYMWASSIIAGIALFMVKDVVLTTYSQRALMFSLGLTCVSFALSILVLWGRNQGKNALTEPTTLATFVNERFKNMPAPYTYTILGLIGTIHDANIVNIAANTARKQKLRWAARLLYLSFIMLCISIILRLQNA